MKGKFVMSNCSYFERIAGEKTRLQVAITSYLLYSSFDMT